MRLLLFLLLHFLSFTPPFLLFCCCCRRSFRRKTQWGATGRSSSRLLSLLYAASHVCRKRVWRRVACKTQQTTMLAAMMTAATTTTTTATRRRAARASFPEGSISSRSVSRPAASPLFSSSSAAAARTSSLRTLDTRKYVAAERPAARLVSRPPFLLLLALSPDDSALAARAHICMRVLVSFSPPLSLSLIYRVLLLPRFSQSCQSFYPSSVSLYLRRERMCEFLLPLSHSFTLFCSRIAYYIRASVYTRRVARRVEGRRRR